MSILVLTSAFCLLTSAFGRVTWHGLYSDAPVAVHIAPSRTVYHVGDTFHLSIAAINTSDRDVLVKRDWKEQLVFYHIRPRTGEQIEWPGRVLTATWLDSADVVRLKPHESYTVNRDIRVWTADDVASFPFRLKLVGVKDFGHRLSTWQGLAWSNAITLTVKPKP